MTKYGVVFIVIGALVAAALPAAAQDSAPAVAFSANPHASLDIDSLKATRSLPLFTPSRAPPLVVEEVIEPEVVVEEEPVVEAAPEPPQLQLVGVVMTEAQQVAILVDESTGEIHRVRAGEDYDGWTLSVVDPRSVAFAMGEDSHSLTLFTEFGRGSMSAHEAEYVDEFSDELSEYNDFSAENESMEDGGDPAFDESGSEQGFGDMYGEPYPNEGN